MPNTCVAHKVLMGKISDNEEKIKALSEIDSIKILRLAILAISLSGIGIVSSIVIGIVLIVKRSKRKVQ